MLGTKYAPALPAPDERRVPGVFRHYSELVWTVDASERLDEAMRIVNRILFRYTCRGHYGLIQTCVLEFPSARPAPCLVDLPGFSASMSPHRFNMAKAAIESCQLYAMLAITKGRGENGGGGRPQTPSPIQTAS